MRNIFESLGRGLGKVVRVETESEASRIARQNAKVDQLQGEANAILFADSPDSFYKNWRHYSEIARKREDLMVAEKRKSQQVILLDRVVIPLGSRRAA